MADPKKAVRLAKEALQAHQQASGNVGEDMATRISDLIADLKHLADSKGISFDQVLDRASEYYDSDIQGE